MKDSLLALTLVTNIHASEYYFANFVARGNKIICRENRKKFMKHENERIFFFTG